MKKILNSNNAPQAIGPYSQGIAIGNLVFLSGQLAINPVTDEIVADIQAQTKQALDNIKAVLYEAGLTVADIVKTTIFVTDLTKFGLINSAYQTFFAEHNITSFPARSCVEVSALPKNAEIEIEAIAVKA